MASEPRGAGPIVTGFGAGGFKVGEQYLTAALLTVEAAIVWTPPDFGDLDVAALQPLVDARPEFILLGSGTTLRRPSPALGRALDALNIGLEVMDSRAAARAWGVLRGEGREITAALYPLD